LVERLEASVVERLEASVVERFELSLFELFVDRFDPSVVVSVLVVVRIELSLFELFVERLDPSVLVLVRIELSEVLLVLVLVLVLPELSVLAATAPVVPPVAEAVIGPAVAVEPPLVDCASADVEIMAPRISAEAEVSSFRVMDSLQRCSGNTIPSRTSATSDTGHAHQW
jgi:hypothetical protein